MKKSSEERDRLERTYASDLQQLQQRHKEETSALQEKQREQLSRASEEMKQRDASYRLDLESVNQVHAETLR